MAQKSIHSRGYVLLCKALVAARHKAGLSQTQLAQRLGRPQSFVAKVEGGERRIDVVELVAIAAIIGLDTSQLLSDLRKLARA